MAEDVLLGRVSLEIQTRESGLFASWCIGVGNVVRCHQVVLVFGPVLVDQVRWKYRHESLNVMKGPGQLLYTWVSATAVLWPIRTPL